MRSCTDRRMRLLQVTSQCQLRILTVFSLITLKMDYKLACVAAGPRTRLNPLYSPLYTEGLERLRRRLIINPNNPNLQPDNYDTY